MKKLYLYFLNYIKKEKPEVLALFASIYKSNEFTADAAHEAFSKFANKK